MDLEHVLYDVRDGVATVTLNEPERLNPISHGPRSMQREIVECLVAGDDDPAVRCNVVTGAGRAFSAGGTMSDGLPGGEAVLGWHDLLEVDARDNARIFELRKPVIGAINGLCYGAALIMALHFDLLVAREDARFGLIETRFGGSGVEMLPFWVGPQWAKFLALTGEIVDARKAKEIGLVVEVVASDEFAERIADLARRVAAMPNDAVVLNRRVINGWLKLHGWAAQAHYAPAVNAITSAVSVTAEMGDGRRPLELLRSEGWEAFKDARDAPFREPWLRG
ncbi:MAG TPA: enoyl-CoA hydratase/isomerase family protein [Solirubrobacteraceae bacterium]|jgi:enoyl-CoA hydratase/carnithine racemase|nr:enoyl-CoA hydratase/isomerase family protein [Solirubrobacteraceae bacterium]